MAEALLVLSKAPCFQPQQRCEFLPFKRFVIIIIEHKI